MGKVRRWNFDAVIGVGGSHPDHGHEEIARKVNWIGIGKRKVGDTPRGPRLDFNFFHRFDESGPDLEAQAPELFRHMFVEKHRRQVLSQNLPAPIQNEVQRLLKWARTTKQLPKPQPIPNPLIVVIGTRSTKCGC